jgi:hypothetical protein
MSHQKELYGHIVKRWRRALLSGDFRQVEPTLANDVRFGSCVGLPQVVDYVGREFRRFAIETADVEAYPDRVIAILELRAAAGEDPPAHRQSQVVVGFARDGRIVELQMAADRDEGLTAVPSPLPPASPDSPTRLTGLAAVLPVRDLAAALQHYDLLGFTVSAYHGGGYGYAERDGLNLHFCAVPNLDPATTTSAIYLYVDDADLLFAEWRSAGVSGQFFEPQDTDYGLREGAHVDRDGNLIRFGSRLDRP